LQQSSVTEGKAKEIDPQILTCCILHSQNRAAAHGYTSFSSVMNHIGCFSMRPHSFHVAQQLCPNIQTSTATFGKFSQTFSQRNGTQLKVGGER
jgi:hypothetical protein